MDVGQQASETGERSTVDRRKKEILGEESTPLVDRGGRLGQLRRIVIGRGLRSFHKFQIARNRHDEQEERDERELKID
jgi:hypothetical protein